MKEVYCPPNSLFAGKLVCWVLSFHEDDVRFAPECCAAPEDARGRRGPQAQGPDRRGLPCLLSSPKKRKSVKPKQLPFPFIKGGRPAKPDEEMTPERVAHILWGSGE